MSKNLHKLMGYIEAFEAINDGNNHVGTNFLIEEITNDGDPIKCIKKYLSDIVVYGKEEVQKIVFEEVREWQKLMYIDLFNSFFKQNIPIYTESPIKKFKALLENYIAGRSFKVISTGNCYSSIAEFFGEISGGDILFIFEEKILIMHFGIND